MKPELYVVLIVGIFLSAVQRSYYLYNPNTKQYVPLIFSVLIGYLGYMGLVGVIKEIGRNNLEGFILLLVFFWHTNYLYSSFSSNLCAIP